MKNIRYNFQCMKVMVGFFRKKCINSSVKIFLLIFLKEVSVCVLLTDVLVYVCHSDSYQPDRCKSRKRQKNLLGTLCK